MANHSFDTNVAKEIGVKSAILLQNIAHWWEDNVLNGRNFRENNYWTYNSRRAYAEKFYYLTPREIQLCLEKMEKDGYILVANYNSKKYDRTLWYAITEKTYNLLRLEIKSKNLQNVYWIKQNVESIEQNVKCFQQNVEPIPNTEPYSNTNTEETPTPFINAEKINDTGAPSVQKPTKTPRGAGADFGAVKEDFEKFRLYAKKIGMTARGLDTEFENFVKKHPKEVLEVAPKLLACVMAFEAEKTEGGKRPIEPKFMPHVQTWINGRRWESYMEMEIETAQVDIMNSLLKMPYAEVGELFKKNVEGKIWERDYAVKLWNDYESKRPKQYTQYPQQ